MLIERHLLSLALLLALGCGFPAPPGFVGATGGSANGSGGTAAGGTDTGGSETGGFASTGGWDGAGGFPGCFERVEPKLVTVFVTNYTGQSIYLGQNSVTCVDAPLFKVFREGGDELVPADGCEHVCGRIPGCTGLCLYPSALTLGPNESTKLSYEVTDYVDAFQPSSCEDAGECRREIEVTSGNYTFLAAAGKSVDCTETISTCGACEPAEGGGCTISAALVPTYSFAAQATVWLDPSGGTSETVYLDFYE